MKRRQFLKTSGIITSSSIIVGTHFSGCTQPTPKRPNILWITCEDLSPLLGCYGDEYAITPTLDQLAAEGVRYTQAYASAPLCTPARSSIISGVFASTLGTQHLRGAVPIREEIRCFTEYLRTAGYYCSNNSKEDYNFTTPATAWDESSQTAHWRKRQAHQPFFSVFNLMTTHQSQVRYDQKKLTEINQSLLPAEQHDPAKAPLPPYYPDTPLVRTNMAALYTQVTLMDQAVQKILNELETDGLAEDTIVFFYSDHGTGLPRGKRWLHDSGIRVPLIIRFPEKYRHLAPAAPGQTVDRLVSFVDFAPTILSLARIPIPDYIQGRAFLGKATSNPRKYIVAIRDRVDEVLEFSRTIRDERYQYIRNFMPHRPRMQRSFYSEITPIRQEIRRLHTEGQLEGTAAWLMQPTKPAEELYDTVNDPHELNNLADSPEHQAILTRLRQALFDWMMTTRDLSLMPEAEMVNLSNERPPQDLGADEQRYPIERILKVADLVGRGPSHLDTLQQALNDENLAVRYWAATGLAALREAAQPALNELKPALSDSSASVRLMAAEALCFLGAATEAVPVIARELLVDDIRVQLLAAQILVVIDEKARPAIPAMKTVLKQMEGLEDHGWYIREAIGYLLQRLEKSAK